MNDSQRYKLIIWHSFLEDINKVKHQIDKYLPGYKINYGEMARVFDWHVKNRKKHEILYPWIIRAKNQKGGILFLSYNYLLNYEPEEEDEDPNTDLPNRWYCQNCQKFVMKNSRIAHMKSKKHNKYI